MKEVNVEKINNKDFGSKFDTNIVNGGLDIIEIIFEYLSKNTGNNSCLLSYINGMNDENKLYTEQKELLAKLLDASSSMSKDANGIMETFKKNNQDFSDGYNMIQSIMGIVKQVEENNNKFESKLEELTEKLNVINDFAKMINEISAKTNLLSFNASIEAARAGETGKGFRVIANEIKKLSDSTNKASKEIEKTISTIGTQMQDLTKDTANNQNRFNNLYIATRNAINMFENIKKDNIECSTSTKKMIENITENMEQIVCITDFNKKIQQSELRNKNNIIDLAENMTENVILFNDLISFTLQLKEILLYTKG